MLIPGWKRSLSTLPTARKPISAPSPMRHERSGADLVGIVVKQEFALRIANLAARER